jgi:hypothetical protein
MDRRTFVGGAAVVGAGASLGLRAGGARAAATQTLTVETNIPFTTLDLNTINTSVFLFRNSVFDSLIDIPEVELPPTSWAISRPRWRRRTASARTIP